MLSVNNNGAHLPSAVCQALCGVLCQPGLTCSHFEVLCGNTFHPLCFAIISSFTNYCHNPCVTPASLELYLMGFASSVLRVHKLGRGKFSSLLQFTQPEGKEDTDLDPNMCFVCCITRRRRDTLFTEKEGDMLKISPFVHDASGSRHSKQDWPDKRTDATSRLRSFTSFVQEQIIGAR